MNKIERDIEITSQIIKGAKKDSIPQNYDRIYQVETENSKMIYENLNIKNGNSLWIGGSGFQALNGVRNEDKSITIVDINPLAIHYIKLNYAAMKALEYEDYTNFLLFKLKDRNLLEKYLKQTSIYLEEDEFHYWKILLTHYTNRQIKENLFFENPSDKKIHYFENSKTMSELELYSELRNKLKRAKVRLLNTDIRSINQIPDIPTLDFIYLSNVFLDLDLSILEYHSFLKEKILPLMSKNGQIMAGYVNISGYSDLTLGSLGTIDEILNVLKKQNYQVNTTFDKNNRKGINKAFIYMKKR